MAGRRGNIIGIAMALVCALSLLVSSAYALPAYAAGTDMAAPVKVGMYAFPPYAYQSEDGTFAGADVEYAYSIAQKAGFSIEIKLYDNESELTSSLNNGDVDVLFDYGKTDERLQKYLFSENPIGSTALVLYVRPDDDRFTYGDISQLEDKTFGCTAGNNVKNIFLQWCAGHGFTPKVKDYTSMDALDAAIDSGEVDAGIISQNGHDGYTTIMTFSSQLYYLMFRSDETELKNKVDSAMSQILAINPLYEEKLLQKYGIATMGQPGFSADEKRYISSHSTVTVAVVSNDSPYYSKARDGSDGGIIPEYYEKLAAFSGISFVYQEYPTSAEAILAVKNGEADVLAMFSDGVITAANEGVLLTDPYESVDSVLLTRAGTDMGEIKKIAVKQRSVNNVKQGIASSIDAEVVPVANAKEGFEALRDGRVDAVICGLPTATWLLNQTNSAAYSTSILSTMQFDLCGATAEDNQVLTSILNKSIAATNYAFDGVVEDNVVQEDTWQTLIARISPMRIVAISAILVFIILMLILALVSLVRRQKEKAAIDQAKADNEKQRLQIEAIERNAEERNRFFSDVSHDMRTPLTAILGYSDLIDGETDPEKIRVENGKIKESGKLLLDLINDTLTLSKVGNNKLELQLVPVDLKHIFDLVIAPIQIAAEEKGIAFEFDQSQLSERTVLADPLNTRKIVLNLLSNAVKYTPKGGHVAFIAKDSPEMAGDPDTILIIKDDGIGMSEEFQRRMFDPFSQESRAGYGGTGTGLGLSIVNHLIELMGGSIDVESKQDDGTAFTMRLHFPSIEDADTSKADSSEEPALDLGILAGKNVLICEDNAMNREIAGTMLTKKGMSVTAAEDGKAGVRVFANSAVGEYAAVLMDLRMPVMDGLEATKAIRALDRPDASCVPIIAMTADAFEDDIKRCLDAGMDGHVAKPIDPDRLFEALAMNIQSR